MVEGGVDQAVATKLLSSHGHDVLAPYVTGGKHKLDARLSGYNNAARFSPWLVLRDLDHDAPCPAALIDMICPEPAEQMRIRVPVREIEAWVLADRGAAARFLGVRLAAVPRRPDELEDPKRTLVDLARTSRFRAIRQDLVPPVGLSVSIGPGYNPRLINFVNQTWSPDRAAPASPSLLRCRNALATF